MEKKTYIMPAIEVVSSPVERPLAAGSDKVVDPEDIEAKQNLLPGEDEEEGVTPFERPWGE